MENLKMVKWILKNEGQMVKALGEGGERCRIMVERITPGGNVCVRPAEISRETLEAVTKALSASRKAMHSEHRKIVFYHYHKRLTMAELREMWGISERSCCRRLAEIQYCTAAFLSLLHPAYIYELRRALEG
jgi:hypothetical protein